MSSEAKRLLQKAGLISQGTSGDDNDLVISAFGISQQTERDKDYSFKQEVADETLQNPNIIRKSNFKKLSNSPRDLRRVFQNDSDPFYQLDSARPQVDLQAGRTQSISNRFALSMVMSSSLKQLPNIDLNLSERDMEQLGQAGEVSESEIVGDDERVTVSSRGFSVLEQIPKTGDYLNSITPLYKNTDTLPPAKLLIKKRQSLLISRTFYRIGVSARSERIYYYRPLTNFQNLKLTSSSREVQPRPREKTALAEILSDSHFTKTDMVETISSLFETQSSANVETNVIVNKFQINQNFRLSPLEDSPSLGQQVSEIVNMAAAGRIGEIEPQQS